MLGRAGEARDPPHERVVAAVRRAVGLDEQLVETMRGSWTTASGNVESESAQARSGHRYDEGGFCLHAGAERFHALADQFAARKVSGDLSHRGIVGVAEAARARSA